VVVTVAISDIVHTFSLVLIERIDGTEIDVRNLDLISRVNKVEQSVL